MANRDNSIRHSRSRNYRGGLSPLVVAIIAMVIGGIVAVLTVIILTMFNQPHINADNIPVRVVGARVTLPPNSPTCAPDYIYLPGIGCVNPGGPRSPAP